MARDRRRVQTAVVGGPDSEKPIILPRQYPELDQFRDLYAGETFWCGVWLGGCGGELTTRRCTTHACHFAHLPHPDQQPCRRRATGVSSADHLYIKAALLQWLADQDIDAHAQIPREETGGTQVGAALRIDPGGHGRLHIQLDPHGPLDPAAQDGMEVLWGTDVPAAPGHLAGCGYVHRIRCETTGTTRRVLLGTQHHAGIDWFTLAECSLEPFGLATPAVREILRLRTTARPLGAPSTRPDRARQAPSRPRAVPVPAAPDRVSAILELRAALKKKGNIASLRRSLTHAQAATASGATAEDDALLREASQTLQEWERQARPPQPAPARRGRRPRGGRPAAVIRRPPPGKRRTSSDAIQELLDALDEGRATFALPEIRRRVAELVRRAEPAMPYLSQQQRVEIARWKSEAARPKAAPPDPTASARPSTPPRPRTSTAPPPPGREVHEVAATVRDVLIHTARMNTTITWARLCAQVRGLTSLSAAAQRTALREAGHITTSAGDRVVLAGLVTTEDGGPHPHARALAPDGQGQVSLP